MRRGFTRGLSFESLEVDSGTRLRTGYNDNMPPVPPPLPPRNIPYAQPPVLAKRPVTSIRQTVTLGAISLILIGELTYVVPAMEQVFKDFKSELPILTQMTLAASHFARNNFLAWPLFIAIPLFVPMLTTALLWKPGLTTIQLRVRHLIFGSLITTFFALIAVLLVVGLFVGYIGLIDSAASMKK